MANKSTRTSELSLNLLLFCLQYVFLRSIPWNKAFSVKNLFFLSFFLCFLVKFNAPFYFLIICGELRFKVKISGWKLSLNFSVPNMLTFWIIWFSHPTFSILKNGKSKSYNLPCLDDKSKLKIWTPSNPTNLLII